MSYWLLPNSTDGGDGDVLVDTEQTLGDGTRSTAVESSSFLAV